MTESFFVPFVPFCGMFSGRNALPYQLGSQNMKAVLLMILFLSTLTGFAQYKMPPNTHFKNGKVELPYKNGFTG